jgi:hypothetical protein
VGGSIRVVCIWQKIHITGIWPLTAMSQLHQQKETPKHTMDSWNKYLRVLGNKISQFKNQWMWCHKI